MSKRYNPSVIESQWKINDEWQLRYYSVASQSSDGRKPWVRRTRLGQVVEISHTSRGVVGGKRNVTLVVMKTNTQEGHDLPFALQPGLLDLGSLSDTMVAKICGGHSSTDIQIARKFPMCIHDHASLMNHVQANCAISIVLG